MWQLSAWASTPCLSLFDVYAAPGSESGAMLPSVLGSIGAECLYGQSPSLAPSHAWRPWHSAWRSSVPGPAGLGWLRMKGCLQQDLFEPEVLLHPWTEPFADLALVCLVRLPETLETTVVKVPQGSNSWDRGVPRTPKGNRNLEWGKAPTPTTTDN